MKVLVIGSGGREHALAWKLVQSARVQTVYVAPGNAGTADEPQVKNVDITDLAALAEFAAAEKIALTVVGPEAALAAGAVDIFRAKGLRIFGPAKLAAELESSKAWAKEFMQRHGIPTARHATFEDAAAAHAHVDANAVPIVVKADGLAAGKGVVVAMSREEAHAAVDAMLGGTSPKGSRVVIEEFLEGEEASFMVLCDGRSVLSLATSQDHKRLADDDQGPNTGGMGAYCDSRILTARQFTQILNEVILPTVERTGFTGFLYAGMMMTADGPKTLEFNVRLGDPETQALMHRMDSDFGEVLLAAAEGRLNQAALTWKQDPSVTVVLAAYGYPGTVRTGDQIHGIDNMPNAVIFQAGTKMQEGKLVTAGGRVLAVTSSGPTLAAAIETAYTAAANIHFEGMYYRHDIGRKGLARWSIEPSVA